ncbi:MULTISPECIES: hypothetical protein [Methylomonas]|uniref:PBS lyase n=1 Tax=Methylomonas koyamae TaxID=702114 RepID=A0A177NJV3_9GAMM|nr:hypothetical protein [Methylomonas koyamae]OAI18171.1 hypothetical protein A1355_06295 [Methylomonas koyamae]
MKMLESDINDLLDKLDGLGSDQEFYAARELGKLGDKLPTLLLKKYQTSRKWQARCSCVFHSIRFARVVDEAVQLGVQALSDKSKVVRYRACMLLACSLNANALSALKELEANATDTETRANAHAAIDAIEHQNSNYFVDRTHSGKVKLEFD